MFRRLPWIAAALAAAPVLAQSPGSLPALVSRAADAAPVVQEFRELRVEGATVHGAVRDVVRTLRWHSRLRDAQRVAEASDKPILWIEALGDLKGYT